MTVARDIPGIQPIAGRKQEESWRKAGQKNRARLLVPPWPVGGTPVVAGVQPPGFAPVTEEVLQAMVHRLVTGLHPYKIILLGSYVYGTPTADSDVDLLVILDTHAPTSGPLPARLAAASAAPLSARSPRENPQGDCAGVGEE